MKDPRTPVIAAESERILEEYRRREREIDPELYAPWNPGAAFLRAGRTRVGAAMLAEAGLFPLQGDRCLEVGLGSLGWLTELLSWGVRQADIAGIEIDASRAERARELVPGADLRTGDATRMPWASGTFRLVVASTVFTSILDSSVRGLVAHEIERVMAPGGALLWYDFAVNNPSNPHVRRVTRAELRSLFPGLSARIRSVTLAPPLARWAAKRSWLLATALEAIPPLRTHLMAVLCKETK